jgi:hypothetical protein
MGFRKMIRIIVICVFAFYSLTLSQSYPDQFFSHEKEDLISKIETMSGTIISTDGKQIILSDEVTNGSVIFKEDFSFYPFDRGLPSWNGHVPNDNSSFRVLMRFYKDSWSPWLTVGYWKNNIWSSYGATNFSDGKIDYDYVVLNSFYNKWQFKIEMKRTNIIEPSPSVHKLSFSISDQRTTDNVSINDLAGDNPPEIFIPTDHFYQYSIDPEFGGDICSPTSVSMALRSYDIEVDPRQFAIDNYDHYWGIYGMWPRAVQNAAEYNLNGSVTRYRNWSDAYDVLAANGRIVMSVGPPLYTGHLMMLAGFDDEGNPLVHDPARSEGYGYKFNKRSLTESWFAKGGISYTFYLEDTTNIVSVDNIEGQLLVNDYSFSVYPNPFNSQTNIVFQTSEKNFTEIIVYDIIGRKIESLHKDLLNSGIHKFKWNASKHPSGLYFIRVESGKFNKTIKSYLVK